MAVTGVRGLTRYAVANKAMILNFHFLFYSAVLLRHGFY